MIEGEEYNGFILYRSPNNVATTIVYHWPNADGTMGERRAMEVIDAEYRNILTYAPSDAYDYDNTALDNFASNGNDGGMWIYNNTSYSHKTAITSKFTNALCCSQWRNLSTDKTATENTAAWMNDSHFNMSGYVPYWTTHLDVDGGNWSIPNMFEVIVIYCCSDKLDEMDPTFNSNKSKGLGYTATEGRFHIGSSLYIWSSTEYNSYIMRAADYIGRGYATTKRSSEGVVPVRELS